MAKGSSNSPKSLGLTQTFEDCSTFTSLMFLLQLLALIKLLSIMDYYPCWKVLCCVIHVIPEDMGIQGSRLVCWIRANSSTCLCAGLS